MKKLVIILALIIANSSLFAQIAIQDFKFGSKHLTPELESFQFKVKEEMNKYFFIYQQDFDGILNEYNISTIRENFKSALKLQFLPAAYMLSCEISVPYQNNKYYNLNFTATETTTRRQFTITAKTVPETELTKVAELVALIYKNSIPAIYGITQVKSNDNIIVNYGTERNASKGQELEIYKFTDDNSIPIGSLEINKVMIQSSICSISKLLDENEPLNSQNYKKFFAQSIIDRKEEAKYRNKLTELEEKDLEVVTPKVVREYRNDDYYIENANFTISNFFYYNDDLKKYFNKELFTPYIFGLQWIIFPSKHVGFYLNGKVSTYSSIPDIDTNIGPVTSKFMMFQGGAGLNINLPMSDILVPGIGFGANYHVFKFAKEKLDGNQEAVEDIKGLDYELRGFCSLRLYDYFALHGEASYHFAPRLTGPNTNINTNAFSFSLGVSIFIKDK